MKKVILDTNFIITCVKQKLDFFEQLELMEFKIIIPDEVISELNSLKELLALKILGKEKFEKVKLNSKNVDNGIIKYAKENDGVLIATLDRAMKFRTKSKIVVIRGKKKLEVV